MAYRYGDGSQMQLLPPSIEEYVASDDPVRAYDAFVESLDELGIIGDEHKVGNSEYNPKAMIKLMVSRLWRDGFRSSRKLARILGLEKKATYHNLSFIWSYGSKFGQNKINMIFFLFQIPNLLLSLPAIMTQSLV